MWTKPNPIAERAGMISQASCRGAILLEVVLALALFVAAAAIVGSSINSSLNSLETTKRQTHAVNLAMSILAEMQMGIRATIPSPPEVFEAPFEDWIWQAQPIISTESFFEMTDESTTTTLQIIVHHSVSDTIHRLTQIVPLTAATSIETNLTEPEDLENLLPEI